VEEKNSASEKKNVKNQKRKKIGDKSSLKVQAKVESSVNQNWQKNSPSS
jgi:hypothetical protein